LREALPTGEPTGQPTGEPSGEPSGQPSDQPTDQPSNQPSGEPTGQPTNQPSDQPSGQPSGQPSAQPSAQPTAQPSNQPSAQPSNQPSDQPSDQPSSQPSDQPSCIPTGQPSVIPTSVPSSQPSSEPSSVPTIQPSSVPSSHPTFISPIGMYYTSGGSDTKPVVWSLPGIGYDNNTLPLYLSVDVWPTNYALGSEQWASVTVNGVSLLDFCSPNAECGDSWFSCVQNVNIADLISEQNGGHIIVEVSTTGVNTGPCDKNGYPLYTRMVLQESLPSVEQLSIWAIIGPLIGGLFIVAVMLWRLYVKYVRERYATVYGSDEAPDKTQADVESCVENEDMSVDVVFDFSDPPVVAKPDEKHANKSSLAKVVPLESDLEMQEVVETPVAVAHAEDTDEEKDKAVDEIVVHRKPRKKTFASYSMELDPEDQELEDDVEAVKQRLAATSVPSTSGGGVNMPRRARPPGPVPSAYEDQLLSFSRGNSLDQHDPVGEKDDA